MSGFFKIHGGTGGIKDNHRAILRRGKLYIEMEDASRRVMVNRDEVPLKNVKGTELLTKDEIKSGNFGGAIVGGMLAGTTGSIIGSLSGPKKSEVMFACELIDGRKFLATANSKIYKEIVSSSWLCEHNEASREDQLTKQEQFLEVMKLIRNGKKKKAIKQYNALTHQGLLESKDFIEKLSGADGEQLALGEYERLKDIEQVAALDANGSGKSPAQSIGVSVADEIKKYAELRDSGVITEEEFQIKKTELLNS